MSRTRRGGGSVACVLALICLCCTIAAGCDGAAGRALESPAPAAATTTERDRPTVAAPALASPSAGPVVHPKRFASTVLSNASAFLNVPTYDGSRQVVHPDVVYVRGGWHGYAYWMAVTPYPYGNDRFENPSIVVSNDGVHWSVPPRLTNPVVTRPACDHNSDPDLVYRPDLDQMYLFYTEQQRAPRCGHLNENRLRLTRSSDGVHWTAPQTVISWGLANTPLYLSPAVVYRDRVFRLWLAGPHGVVQSSSTDGIIWSAPAPVVMDATPWHLDVEYLDARSEYGMLFVDSPRQGSQLMLATSRDGTDWSVYPTPLLAPSHAWDDARIYRATFLADADGRLRVWYSAQSLIGQWHLGYAETTPSNISPLP